ncbi:hypothetical protein COLSTE_01471, partial [Collinsella stercoris DSM 13279]
MLFIFSIRPVLAPVHAGAGKPYVIVRLLRERAMAAAKIGYRGNAIGISAGLGIALPLAVYAATLPFDGVNDAARAD